MYNLYPVIYKPYLIAQRATQALQIPIPEYLIKPMASIPSWLISWSGVAGSQR